MKTLLDVHTHTVASGHAFSTLQEMAAAAFEKGLKLLGITEHAPGIPGTCSRFTSAICTWFPAGYTVSSYCSGAELNIIDYKGYDRSGRGVLPDAGYPDSGHPLALLQTGNGRAEHGGDDRGDPQPACPHHQPPGETARPRWISAYRISVQRASRCWRSTTALSTRSARNSPPGIITSRSCAYARNTRFL